MRHGLGWLMAASLALAWSAPMAFAASGCDDDTLQSKADDGSILVMTSGAVYEVLAGDEIDASLWLPVSDMMICPNTVAFRGRNYLLYEIINVDDREKVTAHRLR